MFVYEHGNARHIVVCIGFKAMKSPAFCEAVFAAHHHRAVGHNLRIEIYGDGNGFFFYPEIVAADFPIVPSGVHFGKNLGGVDGFVLFVAVGER